MEIPQTFRGMELVKIYDTYALYIDPKTGFRECFHFDELVDRLGRALWIERNKKALPSQVQFGRYEVKYKKRSKK